MNWFENWFDSKYYHLLYNSRNEIEAKKFIEKIYYLLPLNSNSNILDLACGKGRHSFELSKYYNNVYGIDLSKNSINLAKKNTFSNPKFFVMDMRNFKFKFKFNLIVNLFTSFGYFDNDTDNKYVLQNSFDHLEENGYFILDYLNILYVLKNIDNNTNYKKDNLEIKTLKKIQNKKIVKEIEVNDNENISFFNEKVQLFEYLEIKNMIQNIGFTIENVYGNYNLDIFDFENSPRMIFLAKKSKKYI